MGGPYKIVFACKANSYELELPATIAKLHPVFNITILKRYVGNVVPALDPIKLEDGLDYEINAILHHWWVGQ